MRRPVLVAAGVAIIAASVALAVRYAGDSGPVAVQGTGKPLVVLILVDTLRKDSLSVYNSAAQPTPQVQAFADDSTVYTRAFAPSSWTTPSVASIMTSKLPSQLGLRHELRRLSEEAVLLPERFQEAGFTTAGVVSNKYCSEKWGFAQGYDLFDESNIKRRTEITSDSVTDDAIRILDAHADEPLYLMVHYIDPHITYNEHPDYLRSSDDLGIEAPIHWEWLRDNYRRLDDPQWQRVRDVYDSEVGWVDAQVGRLVQHLRDANRFDDALVVFTHDHGEEFGDHGSLGHGYNLHDEAIASPLIVHYPSGFGVPASDDRVVSLMDIGPTALSVSGLTNADGMRGLSLLDEHPADRIVRSETDRSDRPLRAAIQGDRKLIYKLNNSEFSLFDLAADPNEQSASEPGADAAALRDAVVDWPARELTAEAEPITIDETERRLLEALGYLDGN